MKTNQRFRFLGALLVSLGTSWMATAVPVTFQVDMSVQQALGNFTPGLDAVQVAGSFNSWEPTNSVLAQSVTNTDIYVGTVDITATAGTTMLYKFVYGGDGWEVNGVGPGGNDNREFSMPSVATNLPLVFFNNQDTLPATRDVTFQVNMSVQMELGNFDPLNDFLDVAGFNGWATGVYTLFQSVSDTNIWEGTFAVPGDSGNTAFYKYIIADFDGDPAEVWESNDVGPGGAQNRELALAATNQTLPVVYFNNLTNVPPSVDVTFQVDMTTQIALGNFVDGVNSVTAAGEFNGWNAVTFVLTNDPGDPMVYKNTTTISAGTGSSVAWQYVIDGVDWETQPPNQIPGDRQFTVAGTNQVLDAVYYKDWDHLGLVSSSPSGPNQVDVSWDPGTLVRLQTSTNLLNAWLEVPGTTGESNATVNVTTPETYFRLIGP